LALANLAGLAQANQKAVPIGILVQDSSGAAIPNAMVKVSTAEASLTGADGETVLHLPPGEYDLVASSPGFMVARKRVLVSGSESGLVELVLPVGHSSGPVVVLNPVSQLQTSSNAVTAVVGADHTLVVKVKESQSLTPTAFAALPHKSVTFRNGHTNKDETYSGVPLTDLLAKYRAPTGKELHGKPLSDYIVATGADGYKAVLSLAETDPSFHPGDVIVADSMIDKGEAKPLDAANGPFKLVVSEDKRPARCVHNLVSIELRTAE